jgi:hypothetical protein
MAYIIPAFLWLAVLIKSRAFSSSLPIHYRIQLIALSLLFVFLGVTGIKFFWWAAFNPSAFYEFFFIQTGVFSPLASLIISLLASIIAHIELCIGFWLAQQKPKALIWGSRTVLLLLMISFADTALNYEKETKMANKDLIYGIVLLIMTSAYLWLFFFCRNAKNRELMKNTQQLAPVNCSGGTPS